MKKNNFKNLLGILFILIINNLIKAQTNVSTLELLLFKKIINQREADSLKTLYEFNTKEIHQNKNFTIGIEFRPRTEFRNGYRQLPNDTATPAFFTSQRSRINITYTQNKFKFHTSIQDLRVWGQYGQTSITGSLNVFQAFVDQDLTDHFTIRLGRQTVELDNGRLFSAANWSQAGRAHDGINLLYSKEKINSELMSFFNQSSENIYGTNFNPTSFSNYKSLQIHYLKINLPYNFTLTTINSADGYQSKSALNTLYIRGTSGSRIEFERGNLYLTMSGYYQYGRLQSGQKINAFYLQPEIQYKIKKMVGRLGFEYMSGDNATIKTSESRSFIPLYGVTWKFMGNMDYFTTFPKDTKNGGLINPYLFLTFQVNDKFSLRTDTHLFYSQNKVLNTKEQVINPYLGFENDLSLKFKFNDISTLDFGFSCLLASKSMEIIRGGKSNTTPIWTYLIITFNPEIFTKKW
jgi:hypothetical protein